MSGTTYLLFYFFIFWVKVLVLHSTSVNGTEIPIYRCSVLSILTKKAKFYDISTYGVELEHRTGHNQIFGTKLLNTVAIINSLYITNIRYIIFLYS